MRIEATITADKDFSGTVGENDNMDRLSLELAKKLADKIVRNHKITIEEQSNYYRYTIKIEVK